MPGGSAKRREPADLPDADGWVVFGESRGQHATLHTNDACQFVLRAAEPVPLFDVDRDAYTLHACSECRWHDGEVERGGGLSLAEQIGQEDFGPEELGLSPLREGAADG